MHYFDIHGDNTLIASVDPYMDQVVEGASGRSDDENTITLKEMD